MKRSDLVKFAGASAIALMGTFAGATYAQTAPSASVSQYATGVTAPGGVVQMGDSMWVSDHLQGFCRLDKSATSTTYTINASTCVTNAVSPGQASFDSNTNFAYVPDNSSKSQGVWRFAFNPTSKTIITSTRSTLKPVLLAPGKGLAGIRTTATVLGGDGNLYVGSIKNGNILQITNPAGATTSQLVRKIGRTSDGRGVAGLTRIGQDVYIAEGAGVSAISTNPTDCAPTATNVAPSCIADPLVSSLVTGPVAITSDGTEKLYIADATNEIIKYTIPTDPNFDPSETVYVPGGSFRFISGLGMANDKTTLFVGNDPTNGNGVAQGFVSKVVPSTP